MPERPVVLINSNEMKPPVAPLALDYIAGHLRPAGIEVRLIDLSFADDAGVAVRRGLADVDPIAVGVTFRNTDDCYYPSCAWFVPRLRLLAQTIRSATMAPIVFGGCGFSVFAAEITSECGTDFGVIGDGEETFLQLARSLSAGADPRSLPGLVWRGCDGQCEVNPPRPAEILDVSPARDLIDNARYFREGGQGNIETKRGCPMPCIYCADPVAKGKRVRCRPPAQIAEEVESLLRQGVDVLHLCDGEFNIPPEHALEVCREMIRRRLGDRVRWYVYCSPHPFSVELAEAMRQAGCVGINFGSDSGCDRMLAALGRSYRRDAIRDAVRACREAGILVMLDLLLGGPGETPESVGETISFIKSVDPDRCGAAAGVRLYPGTPLAGMIRRQGPLTANPNLRGQVENNDNLLKPVFYFDRQLGEDPGALVCDLIAGDSRFFPPPRIKDATNYNYNDNQVLQGAINRGQRGAYWDILRKLAEKA
jgi:tryptophan 2-C-methyltransferase